MFTGIITDVGRVEAIDGDAEKRLTVSTGWETATIDLGASVAVGGACLTVVAREAGRLSFDVSPETLERTTLGTWRGGTRVNLERSLRLGDELGGHLVYGHVDGLATVVDRTPLGENERWRFAVPAELARFIAPKGSVALDGISLTVNAVEDGAVDDPTFTVNIIPHTRTRTSIADRRPGDRLNLEVDMLARYVARLVESGGVR